MKTLVGINVSDGVFKQEMINGFNQATVTSDVVTV